MTPKEYYKSTRMIETRNWTLEMALSFAEEYAEALRKHAVMRSVLADLQSQLESSRQLSPPVDYSEGQGREGMECGLETAIQILEDALTKHFS